MPLPAVAHHGSKNGISARVKDRGAAFHGAHACSHGNTVTMQRCQRSEALRRRAVLLVFKCLRQAGLGVGRKVLEAGTPIRWEKRHDVPASITSPKRDAKESVGHPVVNCLHREHRERHHCALLILHLTGTRDDRRRRHACILTRLKMKGASCLHALVLHV